jgi:hypothetical protein
MKQESTSRITENMGIVQLKEGVENSAQQSLYGKFSLERDLNGYDGARKKIELLSLSN